MLWLPFLSRAQDGPPVQPPRLFPFSIVYTPIPLVSWVLPVVGHVGICTSTGLIYDFAGALFPGSYSSSAYAHSVLIWVSSPQAHTVSTEAGNWHLAVPPGAACLTYAVLLCTVIFHSRCPTPALEPNPSRDVWKQVLAT